MMLHSSIPLKLKKAIFGLGLSSLMILSRTLPAQSGGFTQPQGDVFTGWTFRTFNSGTFEKLELQGYVEYGLKNDMTLLFKIPYQWLEQDGNTTQGFSDLEVGGRYRYFRSNNLSAAIQGIAIVPPGYNSNATPALGGGDVGWELRLPLSQNFKIGKRPGYWTLEIAYRGFPGPRSDEFRAFAEVSQEVIKPLSLALQLDYINSLQDEQIFRPEDANITKLLGQIRFKLLDKTTLVLGGYGNITGSNASGIEVQIWQSF